KKGLMVRLHRKLPSIQVTMELLHTVDQAQAFLLNLRVVPLCVLESSRGMTHCSQSAILPTMHQHSADSLIAGVRSHNDLLRWVEMNEVQVRGQDRFGLLEGLRTVLGPVPLHVLLQQRVQW